MQRTGLAPHFAENGSIRKIVKMTMAPPFLHPARAEDGLAAIDELAAENTSRQFVDGVHQKVSYVYSFVAYKFNIQLS